jgi:hypothetical protein
LLLRKRVHTFYSSSRAVKQQEHTAPGQLLLKRRGRRRIGLAGGRGETGDSTARRLGQQHGH